MSNEQMPTSYVAKRPSNGQASQSAPRPYEVIVVGARPAGASLAIRLGALGMRVLVVDRATHPSEPGVPSCPAVYPPAMQLLDELGVSEADYADDSSRVSRFVIEFGAWFDAHLKLPTILGRNYGCGIDRAVFDAAVFARIAHHPSVEARLGFSVTDVVRDETGAVAGIEGHGEDQVVMRFYAPLVVGADGRFSLIARKVGAKVTEEHDNCTSTAYFADWEGLAPYRDESEPLVHIYVTGRGTDILLLPKPGGLVTVITHQRADRVNVDGDADRYYHSVLRGLPGVVRRIKPATQKTSLVGMKRIANRYLEASGPGWVLVGDAVHHKDPVDGQGIYDALIEAKRLAEAIQSIKAGERTQAAALAWYGQAVLDETHSMFLATMERLRRELYSDPPVPVIKTMMRWMMNDPTYQDRFLRFLCRDIAPDKWLTPSVMAGAILRGMGRDVKRLFARSSA